MDRIRHVRDMERDLILFCQRHAPDNEEVRNRLQVLINIANLNRVAIESQRCTHTAQKLIEGYQRPHFDFNADYIRESMSKPILPQELIETEAPIIILPERKRIEVRASNESAEEQTSTTIDPLLDCFVFEPFKDAGILSISQECECYRDSDHNVFTHHIVRTMPDGSLRRGKRITRVKPKRLPDFSAIKRARLERASDRLARNTARKHLKI